MSKNTNTNLITKEMVAASLLVSFEKFCKSTKLKIYPEHFKNCWFNFADCCMQFNSTVKERSEPPG